MRPRVRRGVVGDLAFVGRLLEDSGLWADHLVGKDGGPDLFVLECEEAVAGCACLCGEGEFVELRSVCVRDDLRGSGWGSKLVERVLSHARLRGVGKVYLRTRVPGFFARFGFRELPRGELARLWEGCSTCPRRGTDECGTTPMALELDDGAISPGAGVANRFPD